MVHQLLATSGGLVNYYVASIAITAASWRDYLTASLTVAVISAATMAVKVVAMATAAVEDAMTMVVVIVVIAIAVVVVI